MSSTGREIMLQCVRRALQDVPQDEKGVLPWDYRCADGRDRQIIIEEFIERVREYKANVQEIAEAGLPGAIAAACTARGITKLLVVPGLPQEWLPGGITLLPDDPPLSYEELDASDGVLTGCRLGIAQTGTIVLDGGAGQGRRALSLVPDYHLCLIREEQIVGQVPEAIRALQESREGPMTFISGPSATSDIELNRVEGVHGPGRSTFWWCRVRRTSRKEEEHDDPYRSFWTFCAPDARGDRAVRDPAQCWVCATWRYA